MGLYEISGSYEDMLGEDDDLGAYEIMGAARRRALPGGRALRSSPPTEVRDLPLGFDSVAVVVKSTTATITTRPQVTFRPDRLVVAAAIAAFFLVADLKIGNKSQLVNSTKLPAEAFSNVSVGVRMKMDTATAGIDVSITVDNIDAAIDHRFNGALIGPAVF